MLYRRLRYVRRRRAGSLHVLGKIMAISIILAVFTVYARFVLLPGVTAAAEAWAISSLQEETEELIRLQLQPSLQYDALVSVVKDDRGGIVAVRPDISGMNLLAVQIVSLLKERLTAADRTNIGVPAGVLFGSRTLRDFGPQLQVDAAWLDEMEVTFPGRYVTLESGSTQYRIDLEIRTAYTVDVPFAQKRHEVTFSMLVAEVILVADKNN